MNPGTSEMHFVAALDRVAGMRGVLCLFEGVCSGAADGYARMTGRAASTLLHLGPGLGNGLANFHNARKARTPIVNIVGEHSTRHLEYDAPLTADVEAFARTVSGCVRTVKSADEVGTATAEVIAFARQAPGQIATLIVPADFSWSAAGAVGSAADPQSRPVPDVSGIARLLGPETGMVLSGSALLEPGLDAAGRIAAATGTRMFAHRNAARLTSGRGCFQPQRIAYFPEPAEAMLAGLRHLILVEAQAPVSFFGYPNSRSYLPPDDCEVHVLAGLHEDGSAALRLLTDDTPAAIQRDAPSDLPYGEPLTPDTIGRVVATLLLENAIIVDEMISSGEPVWGHLLRAPKHDHLPVTGGSIGQGLPVAVGAAVACPDRKVVCLEADGSAMYTLQALWTMAREGLDVTTVIFANGRYRILDIEMKRTGAEGFGAVANDMIDIGRPNLDFVRLSEGLGVPATRAASADEFIAQFGYAMQSRGPRLIEALI